MTQPRLTHALTRGGLALPAGPLRVFEPPEGARAADYTPKTPQDLEIQSRSALTHAWWAAQKVPAARQHAPRAGSALVHLPRAKDAARALIAQAAACADLVIVDGAKTDGVESILKAVKARVPIQGTLSKAHGKTFWFAGNADDFADWQAKPRALSGGLLTRPGVFSADGPDKGSEALVAALPPLAGRVADLGAGWGFLAAHILQNPDVTHLDLVEEDAEALDCARAALTDTRAVFHWADATTYTPAAPVDHVVMNPPFHKGRDGVPALGQAFIRQAAKILKPTGSLILVANRHLPYEDVLQTAFHQHAEIGGTASFKVIRAAKPHRQAR